MTKSPFFSQMERKQELYSVTGPHDFVAI